MEAWLCPEGTVTPASPNLLLIISQLGGPGGQSLAPTAACQSLPVHSSALPLTALQGQGVRGVSAAPSTAGRSAKEGPDFACALFFQGIPSLDIRRDEPEKHALDSGSQWGEHVPVCQASAGPRSNSADKCSPQVTTAGKHTGKEEPGSTDTSPDRQRAGCRGRPVSGQGHMAGSADGTSTASAGTSASPQPGVLHAHGPHRPLPGG